MTRDKNERLWMAGGAVAASLLALGIWMVAVDPELSDADSIRSQTADTQAQNTTLQSSVNRLRTQYAGIDKLRQALDAAHAALPADLALSSFTQQIGAQASHDKVVVTSLTAGTPTALTPAVAPTTTDSATPATSTATAPVSSGIYAIPISVAVSGAQGRLTQFVRDVQHEGPRAALVSTAQLSGPGAVGSSGSAGASSLTMQLQVFVAPPAAAAAPTVPAAPTASSTASTGG